MFCFERTSNTHAFLARAPFQDRPFFETLYRMDDNARKDWSFVVGAAEGAGACEGDDRDADVGLTPPARVEYLEHVLQPGFF